MDVFILGADSFAGLALARELAGEGHAVFGLGFDALPHSSTCYRARVCLAGEDKEAFAQILRLARERRTRPYLLLTDHPRSAYFLSRSEELSLYMDLPLAAVNPLPHPGVQSFLFEKYGLKEIHTYPSGLEETVPYPLRSLRSGTVYRSREDLDRKDPGPFEDYIKSDPGKTRLFIAYFNEEGRLLFYGSARGYGNYPFEGRNPSIYQTKTDLLDAALLSIAREIKWKGYLAIQTKEDPYTKQQYVLSMKALPGPFSFLFQRAGLPIGRALIGDLKESVKMQEGRWGRLGQASFLALYQYMKRGKILDLPLFAYIPLRSFGPLWSFQDPGVGISNSSQTLELFYRGLKRRRRAKRALKSEA